MVTGGVAPQSFCQHDQASSLPSGSTHGAHGARTTTDLGSRQEFSVADEQTPHFVDQSWGMNSITLLSQQPQGASMEKNQPQGSWEQSWGFNNALQEDRPQGSWEQSWGFNNALQEDQPQGSWEQSWGFNNALQEDQPQGSQEQNLGTNNADSTSCHSQWEVNGRTPNHFAIPQQPLEMAQQTNSGLFWQRTSRMGNSIPMPQQNPVRDKMNSQPLSLEQH